jgi:hypothetical protein
MNDDLMAVLMSVRLAGQLLEALPAADQLRFLPDLFPGLPEIRRLNRTATDAALLLRRAETHVAYTGIPFVLAVYQTFLVEVVKMLRSDNQDTNSQDPSKITLDEFHEYLIGCGLPIPITEMQLFDFIRQIRNRIIHFAGTSGSNLRSAYVALPAASRSLWLATSGREFTASGPREPIQLTAQDLIPALAVTKRLSRGLSRELGRMLSRSYWANLVADDYRQASPQRFGEQSQRLRRLHGYAHTFYSGLSLSKDELAAASGILG